LKVRVYHIRRRFPARLPSELQPPLDPPVRGRRMNCGCVPCPSRLASRVHHTPCRLVEYTADALCGESTGPTRAATGPSPGRSVLTNSESRVCGTAVRLQLARAGSDSSARHQQLLMAGVGRFVYARRSRLLRVFIPSLFYHCSPPSSVVSFTAIWSRYSCDTCVDTTLFLLSSQGCEEVTVI